MNAPAPRIDDDEVTEAEAELTRFLTGDGDEDPYTLHADIQRTMQSHVGIFRDEAGLTAAVDEIEALKRRARNLRVQSPERRFNTGWHLCGDVRHLLVSAEAVARAALLRTESRGAHSRLDFPEPSDEWGAQNLAVKRDGDTMTVEPRSLVGAPGLDELVETRRAKDHR